MKIIIVRHGDPDYVNDSLTERGFREAQLLKNHLAKIKVDEFYCSPLGRAVRTSEPTLGLFGKEAKTLPFLEEFPGFILDPFDNGKKRIPWDFMPSYWTVHKECYDRDNWLVFPVLKTGNVEEVYKSVIRDFDAFLEEHGYKRHGNYYDAVSPNRKTVLFFCHFGIECVLLSHLLGISPIVLWQGFIALPTGITTLVTEERENGIAYFRCRGFGEMPHLIEAGVTPSEAGAFGEVFDDKDARH